MERQIIAVNGTDPDNVIQLSEELDKILSSELLMDLKKNTRFVETIIQVEVENKNPLKEIHKTFKNIKYLKKLEEFLGKDLRVISCRIGLKDRIPLEDVWLDINIQPKWSLPDRIYLITIIYRDKEDRNVKEFVKNTNKFTKVLLENLGK